MPFIFDTNSFRVVGNYYPSQFPSFWERFGSAVEKKDVLSVREVYSELVNQIKDDWLVFGMAKSEEGNVSHAWGGGGTVCCRNIQGPALSTARRRGTAA